MSAGNTFAHDRFVDERVGFMVGADGAASCTRRGFTRNVARAETFVRTPRVDPRATAFGRCVVYR